ncbi:MAG TPA: uracil-DNA glycosylase [Thermoanaerobaculia bacterium]|nr:uracil-DNA glycosylase [Thermoanaerobaculia bacterium]
MPASRFDRFLTELANTELSDRACNQYSRVTGDVRANAIRRANLKRYFEQLEEHAPRVLLVGEAVSHRGGNLTGIAFCSETIMLDGVTLTGGHRILGESSGYRKATTGATRSTEASATMVWGTIRDIAPLPLLWNSFPFHPFHPGQPLSNRVPSSGELVIGERFIAMLLRLFPIAEVLAIGNQASASLTKMQIAHEKLRHPSMGGKQKFVEGMARLGG